MPKRFTRNTVGIKDVTKYDKELGTDGDFYFDGHQGYVFHNHEWKKVTEQTFTATDYPDQSQIPQNEMEIGDTYLDKDGHLLFYLGGEGFQSLPNDHKYCVDLAQLYPDKFRDNSKIYFACQDNMVTVTGEFSTITAVQNFNVQLPAYGMYAPAVTSEIRVWCSFRPYNPANGNQDLTQSSGDGSSYVSLVGSNLKLNNLSANYNHSFTTSYTTIAGF